MKKCHFHNLAWKRPPGLIFDEFYTARRAEFEFDVFQTWFDNPGLVLQRAIFPQSFFSYFVHCIFYLLHRILCEICPEHFLNFSGLAIFAVNFFVLQSFFSVTWL